MLVKQLAGFELDFGGIAKGDAADRVLQILASEFGITRALVDASGDLVAAEAPPGQPGWVVGLARPVDERGLVERLYLRHQALASSGDATQFVEVDRKRWSHLIDPHRKQPIIGQNLTLVFASDGASADAWASALAVCPEETFHELTQRNGHLVAKRYHRAHPDHEIQTQQTSDWEATIRRLRVP